MKKKRGKKVKIMTVVRKMNFRISRLLIKMLILQKTLYRKDIPKARVRAPIPMIWFRIKNQLC